MEKVQKIISNAGICSRRNAEKLIIEGKVFVNGKKANIGDKADGNKDTIKVENKILAPEPKRYIIFNKPLKVITSVNDPKGRKTVMDFIRVKERVFPVGRLDYLSEGLLVLTNDGDFAQRLIHPSNESNKTYEVRLNKSIFERDILKIQHGVKIEDKDEKYLTSPAQIKLLNRNGDYVSITIQEGKKRIVRKIFDSLEYKVLKLQRTAINKLVMKKLAPGEWRDMTDKELNLLLSK